MAVSVFAIAFGAITSSLLTSTSLVHGNRESAQALDAARSVIAQMRATPFAEVYARFNDNPADDPATGVSPGSSFTVRGLEAVVGDPDGMCGSISFPGDGFVLREDGSVREFGTPRDLNGDAAIDSDDHGLDYTILPVRVRVAWRGQSGVRRVEFVTALSLR